MNFHIITLFPDAFNSYLNESIIARAIKNKKIKVKFYNPRDFVSPTKSQSKKDSPYLRVDNKPYGGGPGMVMEALPIIKTVDKILKNKKETTKKDILVVWLSPNGKQFDTAFAKNTPKKYKNVIIICGRYEGIDERAFEIIKNNKSVKIEKLSVGPFVLTGGELPAMFIIDSTARQIEGVLGNFDSREEERIAGDKVYTRPEILEYKGKKYHVPKVLLSGDHKKIDEWRNKN